MPYAIRRTRRTCARLLGAIVFTALAALVAALAPAPANAQWKPERAVEIIVGTAAGGGNDKTARVIQRIFKDMGLVEVNVVNRVGGGGAVAYTYVSQKGGGAEAVTNVLGGHIDAMAVAINNSIPHQKAGAMRILAVSSAKRSPDLPGVSTFREQGFDVVMEGWTVFMGPKAMPAAQVAYWEQAFAKAVNQPQWKQYLEQNAWEWGYKNAKDTGAYVKQDYDLSKRLLTELGMAKTADDVKK